MGSGNEKMDGKIGGFYQIGRGVRGKQAPSNIQRENGQLILMTEVIFSFSVIICYNYLLLIKKISIIFLCIAWVSH